MNTKNSPFTNFIGATLCLVSITGLLFLWFFPDNFYGSWKELIYVFLSGLTLIMGMADETLSNILNRIKLLTNTKNKK